MHKTQFLSGSGLRTRTPTTLRASSSRLVVYARDPLAPGVDYKLRRGNRGDLAEIARLVWQNSMNPLGLEPERFTCAIENGTGKFLGCVQVEPKPRADKIKYYELRTMVVEKEYRNRGIGRTLMEEALKAVPKDADVWLTTVPASASFYARHGFDIIREDLSGVPNEIYFEQMAGQMVASTLKGTNVLILKREKAPLELPKYF